MLSNQIHLNEVTEYLPKIGLIITFFIFIYFAYLLLRQLFSSLKNARFIEDTPTSKIRSAPQGYVELEGTAKFTKLYKQKAPLTYLPCCWYSYQIEEWVTRYVGNKRESRWEEVMTGHSPHLFLISDDTGECVVSPIGAQITTKHEKKWQSANLPSHLDKKRETFGAGRRFRFTENRINPGDKVYLLGHFETTHHLPSLHNAKDYEKAPNKNQKSVFFFLLPKTQDIEKSNSEWEKYQETVQSRYKQHEINIMRNKPRTNQPYLISSFSQKKLARRYRWQALRYGFYFTLLSSVPFVMVIYSLI